jgi:hypothetical protein
MKMTTEEFHVSLAAFIQRELQQWPSVLDLRRHGEEVYYMLHGKEYVIRPEETMETRGW